MPVQVVMAIPGQNIKRGYRVTGLTEEPVADATFMNEQENKEMTVAEYFQQQYGIRYAGTPLDPRQLF